MMYIAFVIWSFMALLFVGIGWRSGKMEKPAGFWANAPAPEVRDIKAYNCAVRRIWYGAACGFELVGLPLLRAQENRLLVIIPILGTVFLFLVIMVVYTQAESRYRK